MDIKRHIDFKNCKDCIKFDKKILYYNNIRLCELDKGSYDMEYILHIIWQCKTVSRTIPANVIPIGIDELDDRYVLVV